MSKWQWRSFDVRRSGKDLTYRLGEAKSHWETVREDTSVEVDLGETHYVPHYDAEVGLAARYIHEKRVRNLAAWIRHELWYVARRPEESSIRRLRAECLHLVSRFVRRGQE